MQTTRKVNFGVPGSDVWTDCLEPSCCTVCVQLVPGVGSVAACLYTLQHLENDRTLLAQATSTGAPRLLLNTEVAIELPSVLVDQPRRV